MKLNIISRLVISVAFAVVAAPLFATTLSVPTDQPAFTVDIPADWKPKTDKADKSVEAADPNNHVYMAGWLVTGKDDPKELESDLEGLLKDSMKSIEDKTGEEVIDNNGIKFFVIRGNGVDKREGTKVKFFVALFDAGDNKIGVFYVYYDSNAPADVAGTINTVMNSIKLKK
jgi:hypothetical protein